MVDSYNTILRSLRRNPDLSVMHSRFLRKKKRMHLSKVSRRNIMMHDTTVMHLRLEKRIPSIVFQMMENRREPQESRY